MNKVRSSKHVRTKIRRWIFQNIKSSLMVLTHLTQQEKIALIYLKPFICG